jgi:hypothetical protein
MPFMSLCGIAVGQGHEAIGYWSLAISSFCTRQ